ncbi:MAG: hypothetical protein LBB48_10200, partial [Treponema sp.]|nr:hypothetical protein [Treponema sp.]
LDNNPFLLYKPIPLRFPSGLSSRRGLRRGVPVRFRQSAYGFGTAGKTFNAANMTVTAVIPSGPAPLPLAVTHTRANTDPVSGFGKPD